MKSAIGEGMTRKDHDALSNQVQYTTCVCVCAHVIYTTLMFIGYLHVCVLSCRCMTRKDHYPLSLSYQATHTTHTYINTTHTHTHANKCLRICACPALGCIHFGTKVETCIPITVAARICTGTEMYANYAIISPIYSNAELRRCMPTTLLERMLLP
jgi:hypothetical protein